MSTPFTFKKRQTENEEVVPRTSDEFSISGPPIGTQDSERSMQDPILPYDAPSMVSSANTMDPIREFAFPNRGQFQQSLGAGPIGNFQEPPVFVAAQPSKARTFPPNFPHASPGYPNAGEWNAASVGGSWYGTPESAKDRGFLPHVGRHGPLFPSPTAGEVPTSFVDVSTRPLLDAEYPNFVDHLEGSESVDSDIKHRRKGSDKPHYSQRRTNKDEFDGNVQFLPKPSKEKITLQEQELPHMPVTLDIREQDEVLRKVNGQLSQCAFDFIAKYQFPVPLEADKRPVQKPGDREWTEWAYLIKRLATKRRIPARVLYNGQIKQLVTILENSLEMRHASAHQSRPPKDDRNVLQLISAGIQVTKMLKDAVAMAYLDQLYQDVEQIIRDRRHSTFGFGR